jgi:hypothetical protein
MPIMLNWNARQSEEIVNVKKNKAVKLSKQNQLVF